MSDTYHVVLTGELIDGFELAGVKDNVAKLFKLSPAKADGLFAGKPVVLRRGVDKAQALKLRKALAAAGAKVVVKVASAVPSETKAPTAEDSLPVEPAQKPQQAASARLTCPRCGHEQVQSNTCSACKMDLRLYLIREEKKEKMRLFRQQAK